ncbi:MOSC domain-containing protein [Demequina aurantiaca]|uniref:MOSC domain-containing protein n=1 Tax=Demequina aurantiaca TaxID=676200 RepID=UPI003D33756D
MDTVIREPVVVSLRRYPVKAMGGEALESVLVDPRGLAGDRVLAVSDGAGRFASGKNTKRMVRREGIFEFAAHTSAARGHRVVVTHEGREWTAGSPELDSHLSEELAAQVHVSAEGEVPHFDDGAVSLVGTATLEWCARELGVDADSRRLRVNLVVQTSEPFEEESWRGDIRVGDATLRPAGRVERCRTIDLVQDGVGQRTRWLKPLGDQRDARVAIYLAVVSPGTVRVGSRVSPSV